MCIIRQWKGFRNRLHYERDSDNLFKMHFVVYKTRDNNSMDTDFCEMKE